MSAANDSGREMIDKLTVNVKTELELLGEIAKYFNQLGKADEFERKVLEDSIKSLSARMKIINNAVPALLAQVSVANRLPSKPRATALENINFQGKFAAANVTLKKEDREKFVKELSFSEELLKKLKKKKTEKKEEDKGEFKRARGYLKLANKYFLDRATNLIGKGYFESLEREWKKTDIDILFQTYIAMMLLTTVISIGISIVIFAIVLALNFSLTGLMEALGALIIVPIATFFALYLYPSTEKSSEAGKIDQELPFAVIQMSAIAGSGIEPSKIFQIIGLSDEYPSLKREMRKIINQINIYGYDLVTALNNVSKATPSEKLAELLAGLSTTISTGGALKEFFEQRAESLLLSYRLEREKYAKTAETFMDIYISVVIATPMILLLLLVMLSISGINLGLSTNMMTMLIIGVVALINVVFLVVMHLKQPAY
jgi:flagellar protein FlaJ